MNLRLKELRESRGITQTYMAKRLGYKSVSGYNAIEQEKRKLDLLKAKEIADIFGVSIEELFFEESLHIKCKNINSA